MANTAIVNVYAAGNVLRCEATPWFPADIKPVHKGLYIVGSDALAVMLEWDGEKWRSANKAAYLDHTAWRGWTGRFL